MKILIIHAHENPNSFCAALAKLAITTFEQMGHEVVISDLYKMDFNPVGGKHDFEELSDAEYYKYALEQLKAHQKNTFAKEVKAEMDKVVEADVLIFNFPLWWFGMPAILKGWVDRVLAYSFAYGGEYGMRESGRFKGRKAILSITTGSPASFYEKNGYHGRTMEDILKNIRTGILELVGYEVLEPFVAFGVSRISEEERKAILKGYGQYLEEHLV